MKLSKQNGRDVAISALRDRAGNVSAHLRRLLDHASISAEEKALAAELALGCVRRKGTLEAVLRSFLKQPERRMPSPLNEILQIALYQILFLERVPDFAAVNEAVEQAKRYKHKRQGGLVNGVLRSVIRSLSPPASGEVPLKADVIPVGVNTYRTADRAIFADPSSHPGRYLAAAFSLPEVLAGRWLGRYATLEKVAEIAMHANVRAPVILRVNSLRADVEQVVSRLEADGLGARPHANGNSVVLDEHANITELGVFGEGLVQPQDAAATDVCIAARAAGGMAVLDFCAAPGTKTTHLGELMGNRGSITAIDVSREKLERIEANCERMGVTIVQTMLAKDIGSLAPQSYDLVLADVPCSNTGVLARRAEARWRFDEKSLGRLVADQKLLISAAGAFVRPGGRLVYSTCSIEPEECDDVARWLDRHEMPLRLTTEKYTLPAGASQPVQWRDGGYVAIFEAK